MKVSFSWLKEFVNISEPPEKIADRFAISTAEVEEIIDFRKLYKDILVGEIKEISKHPNADHLSVAKVALGRKRIQIVFGGNLYLKVGNKLPVIMAPGKLPNGLLVEKRNLRSVESQGMIVSNKELGYDYNGDEIMFFGKGVKSGEHLFSVLGLSDVVMDLDILSNRPDLFSHIGVAREIAAITRKKIKYPELAVLEDESNKAEKYLDVSIFDKKSCPRYSARVISNLKVGESPDWIKKRLISLGVKPINNVVDITNYVMFELGQPLHAFDYDKLFGKKKKIVVRCAKPGEEITTLDDKKRKLTKDILLITDSKKPIAIGGVMGGKNTEVSQDTKRIILESANFNWTSIRKASRTLGLRTEAVNRFEKGIDPKLTLFGLDRAARLISEVASGVVAKGIVEKKNDREKAKKIDLRAERVNKILGTTLTSEKISKLLSFLEISSKKRGDVLEILVPFFRTDIINEIDIVEEIARMFGYDNIPVTNPVAEITTPSLNEHIKEEKSIKSILRSVGFSEVYTYSFVGEELISNFFDTIKDYFELKNPLKPEHTFLRKTLIYSLVETASANAKNFDEFSIFEISKVFNKQESKYPKEDRKIGIASYGKDPFYKVKGALEEIFERLNVKKYAFDQVSEKRSFWHPQRVAKISINNKTIGVIGEIHPKLEEKFDLKNDFAICEIDFEKLINEKEQLKYNPYSKYPKVIYDVAFIVDERTEEKEVRRLIKLSGGNIVSDITLFDVYRGRQIETGNKSLAYRISYQSPVMTLTEEETKKIFQKTIKEVEKKFKAKVRSSSA